MDNFELAEQQLLETEDVEACMSCQEGVLAGLKRRGWNIVPPYDTPGVCNRCRCPIDPGTVHTMFNGNQMFACTIVDEATNKVVSSDG